MTIAIAILLFASAMLALLLWRVRLDRAREMYIRQFAFPKGVFGKVITHHPHLTMKDMELVSHGLRQFFLAYLKSGKRYVSMPSQLADDLWHEFILYTKHYQDFNRRAFGSFLHHTPAVVLSSAGQANVGLRRCWHHVCREENINPRQPSRLPLLFVLDTKFDIPNGFRYLADCSGVRRQGEPNTGATYCGGDFSDASIDGGTSGFDGSDGDGSSHHSGDGAGDSGADSGGDGGGDGGGCGGGCGGD